MVHEGKVLAAKADSLSSIPGIHTLDHGLSKVVSDLRTCAYDDNLPPGVTMGLSLALPFPRPSQQPTRLYFGHSKPRNRKESIKWRRKDGKWPNSSKMGNIEDAGPSAGCLVGLPTGCAVIEICCLRGWWED